ncbi:MAG TPA: CBS domain-containing protein, partial [Chitinophagaceae bacterium]|nr:CBS domain-containing protein [Chitinophagaceae bacterium]
SLALHLMDEYDVQHLPIVHEEKFAGLVCKDDLLDTDENNMVASLEYQFIKTSIRYEDHFLAALKQISESNLSLVAVINEQSELKGVITVTELIKVLSKFTGSEDPGGIIVLEMERRNYSFGEINRLVETNDASILQLNSIAGNDPGMIVVTIKINKIEVSDIVATFQRYDYQVQYYFGEEHYTNELKENYNHLLSYLNI